MQKRANRVRLRLRKLAYGKPRLSVFRSSKNIYAQVVDDVRGKTLVAASSLEKDVRDQHAKGSDKKAAEIVGRVLADRALKAGLEQVVFDRGAYLYHGRVQALADGARTAGLKF